MKVQQSYGVCFDLREFNCSLF